MSDTKNAISINEQDIVDIISDMHVRTMNGVLNDLFRAYDAICRKPIAELTQAETIVIELWQKFVTKIKMEDGRLTYYTPYGEYRISLRDAKITKEG